MDKVRLGFVGVGHRLFDQVLVKKNFETAISVLRNLSKEWDFDLFVEEKLIIGPKDAKKVREIFQEKRIDIVLILNTAFSSGEVVSEIAQCLKTNNVPVVLWDIPEPTGGKLKANLFCCENFYVSILHSRRVPYKWIFGSPNDQILSLSIVRNL